MRTSDHHGHETNSDGVEFKGENGLKIYLEHVSLRAQMTLLTDHLTRLEAKIDRALGDTAKISEAVTPIQANLAALQNGVHVVDQKLDASKTSVELLQQDVLNLSDTVHALSALLPQKADPVSDPALNLDHIDSASKPAPQTHHPANDAHPPAVQPSHLRRVLGAAAIAAMIAAIAFVMPQEKILSATTAQPSNTTEGVSGQ
jgi:hypothetical protein